jgi:hypothetical protein
MDDAWLSTVLGANANKSFVQRIIKPKEYPSLSLKKGEHSTHLMAWSEVGGKYIAYPTILYSDGKLKKYSPDEALTHVLETGNFIEFDKPEEAEWFSKNYKRAWEPDFGSH